MASLGSLIQKNAADALLEDFLGRERLSWLLSGLAPCGLVLITLAGILWGSDASLQGPTLAGDQHAADGIAWLSLVALCMLIAFGVLQLVVRPLVRHWLARVSGEVDERLQREYSLAVAAVWPRLVQILPPEGAVAVRNDGRRLASRAGLAIGYLLTAGLAALVLMLARPHHWVLLGVVTVVASLLGLETLSEIPGAARAYAKSVVYAVDLHRFALLRTLHLPLPKEPRARATGDVAMDVRRRHGNRWHRIRLRVRGTLA
jgi:hypothetical protein